MGFLDATASALSSIARPSMLVLHKVQFAMVSGLRMCAKCAWTLNVSASNGPFALALCASATVLAASCSIILSAIWASYRLPGLGQT